MKVTDDEGNDLPPFNSGELPLTLAFTIAYQYDPEDGWWTSQILELNGCVSQGRSKAEARAMVFDAARLMLEVRAEERRARIIADPEGRIDEEETLTIGMTSAID